MSDGKEGKDEGPSGPEPVEIGDTTYPPLADGQYDAIVLGTGLKECILSGLLSVNGFKVLVVDRNDYYGAEAASLNLQNLYKKFRGDEKMREDMGPNRDYNVDLIPKVMMACGKLVKILLHTKVTRYLDFLSIDGSFVSQAGVPYKVPATAMEAARTGLVGFWQKRKLKPFLTFCAGYEEEDPSTHNSLDLTTMTCRALFEKYGLNEQTQLFMGHAMALFTDDAYLDEPAINAMRAIKLYAYSLDRYANKSPFLYPVYGLGGLPEGFSRLCAINGGVFMLDRQVDEVLFDGDGNAVGVRAGEEAAKCTMIIGDPSYFATQCPEKVERTGQVARSICLLNHPLPHANVKAAKSGQIIMPQAGRPDIYVSWTSGTHRVVPEGMYVAIVSTTVVTDDPLRELAPGLALLGEITERFDSVSDTFKPTGDGMSDRCFISESYDATSHFETVSDDVLSIYERVTGEALDMTINADTTDCDEDQ